VRRQSLTRTVSRILAACIITGLFAGAWPASAQSTAPYELHTQRELILSAGGAGLLLAGLAVKEGQEPLSLADIAVLDPADINAFDRPATRRWSPDAATASDILAWSLLASPVVFAASELEGGNAPTLAVMYVETLLLKNGVVQLLKGTTARTRPLAYNDDPDLPEGEKLRVSTRRSFPSGHTANAFAAAVFLGTTYSRLHPDSRARTWVWVGSLTAAGTVGFLRYGAGRHFPTDVIAGALLGSAIGYLVPKLHETDVVYTAPSSGSVALGLNLRF
jgi:membrane-associated phospholipid phosphatase